jgi:pyruvate/2-oxoglutarate dehydrogenase complex dihydrolipoamide dehydrogenase (E3) component
MNDYDVIVLGGGSAGSSAARAAVSAGARTLMVNDGELGGLCILRGCMPTKAMLASAHAVHDAARLEPFGARLEGRVVTDFARIMERKAGYVARFQRAKIRSVESQDYEVLFGKACFAPGGGVEVDGQKLSARRYVIATGSAPTFLPLPGLDRVPVLTSDDVMRLEAQPASLVVQGAGPIGLELSQFFARIGTRVLQVNRSPLLSHFDLECGEELGRALAEETNLELAVPGSIEKLEPTGDGLVATVLSGDRVFEYEADALLMATGRHAALDDLGLEHVGLKAAGRFLEHDAHQCTANADVYVAGDATGSYQILHLANLEGEVAGHNAAGGRPARTMDYRLKMAVIFTDPPFAQIGASESEARREGRDPVTGRARFAETGRAITMSVNHGMWKLYACRSTGEILGSSILGPRADDLIHVIAALMHYRAGIDRIFELPWYHPTLSEVMLNIARDAVGQIDATAAEGHNEPPPGDCGPLDEARSD